MLGHRRNHCGYDCLHEGECASETVVIIYHTTSNSRTKMFTVTALITSNLTQNCAHFNNLKMLHNFEYINYITSCYRCAARFSNRRWPAICASPTTPPFPPSSPPISYGPPRGEPAVLRRGCWFLAAARIGRPALGRPSSLSSFVFLC
jgi:hypothetical protein